MSATPDTQVTVYGDSDDLVEFRGAVYGESPVGEDDRSKVVLTAPDGTKMRLLVEFCGDTNPDGWHVTVTDNPGEWPTVEFASNDDEPDTGLIITVPEGTKGKCDGKKVH